MTSTWFLRWRNHFVAFASELFQRFYTTGDKFKNRKIGANFFSDESVLNLNKFLLITNLTHFFQCIYLFHFSTCFEQASANHQENRIVSIHHLVYITLCRWLPGMPVRKEQSYIYTRWCIDTIRFSWWWALGCSKHVEKWNK